MLVVVVVAAMVGVVGRRVKRPNWAAGTNEDDDGGVVMPTVVEFVL